MFNIYITLMHSKQIRTSLDLEQRMPSARLYFSEDMHVITRDSSPNCTLTVVNYLLEYLLNNSFDCKVNALQDSNEKNEKLIEEYQVTMIYYVFCCNYTISEKKPNSRS